MMQTQLKIELILFVAWLVLANLKSDFGLVLLVIQNAQHEFRVIG